VAGLAVAALHAGTTDGDDDDVGAHLLRGPRLQWFNRDAEEEPGFRIGDDEYIFPDGSVGVEKVMSLKDLTCRINATKSHFMHFDSSATALAKARALEAEVDELNLTIPLEEELGPCGASCAIPVADGVDEEDFDVDWFFGFGKRLIVVVRKNVDKHDANWPAGEAWTLFHSSSTSNLKCSKCGERGWKSYDDLVDHITTKHPHNPDKHIGQIQGIKGYFPWKGHQGIDEDSYTYDWEDLAEEMNNAAICRGKFMWYKPCSYITTKVHLTWFRKCQFRHANKAAAQMLKAVKNVWSHGPKGHDKEGADIYRRWVPYWYHCDMPKLMICIALSLPQGIDEERLLLARHAGGCPPNIKEMLMAALQATGDPEDLSDENVATVNNRLEAFGVPLERFIGWSKRLTKVFPHVK